MAQIQTSLYKRQVVCLDTRNRDGYSESTQNWAGPSVQYGVGDTVFFNTQGYVCALAHASNTLFTVDLAAGRWTQTNISSPSNYKIRFPALRNVKMMRLISVEMTNSQYVINHKNRFIDFLDSAVPPVPPATCLVAPLSVGTYTSATLANEINTQLNAATGVGFGVNYTVAYTSVTQKFTVTRLGGGPTTRFLFKTGPHGSDFLNQTCARVIGFVPTLDTVAAAALISPNLVNLAGENSLYMVIKGYPAVVTGGAIQDTFAKIILNVVPRNVVFNSFAANSLIFANPVDVIDNFEVKILEMNGFLYDFFNVDYSFSVEAFCE